MIKVRVTFDEVRAMGPPSMRGSNTELIVKSISDRLIKAGFDLSKPIRREDRMYEKEIWFTQEEDIMSIVSSGSF